MRGGEIFNVSTIISARNQFFTAACVSGMWSCTRLVRPVCSAAEHWPDNAVQHHMTQSVSPRAKYRRGFFSVRFHNAFDPYPQPGSHKFIPKQAYIPPWTYSSAFSTPAQSRISTLLQCSRSPLLTRVNTVRSTAGPAHAHGMSTLCTRFCPSHPCNRPQI